MSRQELEALLRAEEANGARLRREQMAFEGTEISLREAVRACSLVSGMPYIEWPQEMVAADPSLLSRPPPLFGSDGGSVGSPVDQTMAPYVVAAAEAEVCAMLAARGELYRR